MLPLAVAACGGDDLDVAAFCERARSLDDLDQVFESEDLPDADAFAQQAEEVAALAEDAPDEVAGDLEVIAGALAEIAGVVINRDLSDPSSLTDPADPAAITELAAELESLAEDVERAQAGVDGYLEQECGLTVDDE